MRPQYEPLAVLDQAWSRAGAQGYTDRWGPYAELRQAARHFAVLNAIYGQRRDITEHLAGHVLRELAASADETRLQDLVNHYASRPTK